MTTEELAELFLTALYDLAEAAPHPNFIFSMNEFASRFGISDPALLRDVILLLESRGLIYCASFDFGSINAGITMDGMELAEKGGVTGIIPRYRANPEEFWRQGPAVPEPPPVHEPVPPPAAASRPGSGKAFQAVIGAIEAVLEADPSLSPDEKGYILQDVEILSLQLSRPNPNRLVVSGLIDNISAVPSIGPLILQLKQLMG